MPNPIASESAKEQKNAAELEQLEQRFRFAGRGNGPVDTLCGIAQERLLAAPYAVPQKGAKPPKVEPFDFPVTPLDPVSIVQMEVKLPPLPSVLAELQEATSSRNSSAGRVAEIISKDPGLTAWVLKLVNSPFFGFSVKVDTVSRAVTLLGMQQIQTLAMGGMLNNLAVRIPADILNLDAFWRHSLATGIAAQAIWKLLGRSESERLFVAGLLHDCGVLALAYASPKTFRSLRARQLVSDAPNHVLEKDLLNFDHARLGGMLLHRWNMPLPLVMAVLRHHDVESPQRYPEAAAVHLADIIAFALVEAPGENNLVPPLSMTSWDSLGLPPNKLNFVAEVLFTKLDELHELLRS